jgi:abortive infection bacteriophage resistance protein
LSLKKTCEKSACSGTISNDSAGDTSQRCDKAPAHFVSGTGIKSPEQLLSRLSDKGLAASDVGVGMALLGTLGYTHVVRYVPAHVAVVERPSFSTLYRDITLDHAFQGALLTHIIRFERSFKSQLSNALANEAGEFAHMERSLFKDEGGWKQFVDGSRSEIVQKARKGSRYAARIASQGRQVPIWSALEFSSLGVVSKLFANLTACEAKRSIALHYGLDTSFVESWLFSLIFVRNECAHGGVLYGRELEIQPRAHRLFPQVSNRHAFYQVLILSWLLERDIPDSSQTLIDDVAKLLSCGSLRLGLAAPKDWIDDVRNVATMAGSHIKDKVTRSSVE